MDLKELGTWKMDVSSELFYNEADKQFFVIQDSQIFRYIDANWTPTLSLPNKQNQRYKNACISSDGVIFCFTVNQNEIVSSN